MYEEKRPLMMRRGFNDSHGHTPLLISSIRVRTQNIQRKMSCIFKYPALYQLWNVTLIEHKCSITLF